MVLSGVIAFYEHNDKLVSHKGLFTICYTCGCISGVWFLEYCVSYEDTYYRLMIIVTLTFIGLLASAVMMDLLWQEIYEFVWVVSAMGGGICLAACRNVTVGIVISLALYFLMQETIMRYVYGIADCHAFCCCALFMAVNGLALEYYVLHMAISWLMLTVSQLICKNVDYKLKLKKPVAMIPHIASGLIVVTAFVHFP